MIQMDGVELVMLVPKLHSGTFKTKETQAIYSIFDILLCNICIPARLILYHVIGLRKGSIGACTKYDIY